MYNQKNDSGSNATWLVGASYVAQMISFRAVHLREFGKTGTGANILAQCDQCAWPTGSRSNRLTRENIGRPLTVVAKRRECDLQKALVHRVRRSFCQPVGLDPLDWDNAG